jgi:hypothetical protein
MAGYPHNPECPYPYYGRDEKRESDWNKAYQENRMHAGLCTKANKVPAE